MNEFSIQIKWNKAETLAHLSWVERDQYPYAHAKALTRVAQEAAEKVREETKKRFELKTDFIPKGIAIKAARKQDIVAGGRATSEVFTRERIGTFMIKHEEGGVREPETGRMGGGSDTGRMLALPGKGREGQQFSSSKESRARLETASGKIRAAKTPHGLLQGSEERSKHTRVIARGGRKGKPFIIKGCESEIPMIVRRVGKKRYPLEILYIFRPSASYKATWEFVDTVTEYVNANYERIFKEELRKAVEER